ncbi:hypothetical protein DM02DRAFT_728058 [Periconia macrospinosa]|uniref:RING-type domain-containing protein n=1 Tax=Periconia macrospinosa TaxID=97972 RepID=A0A2V1DTH9_9PLEO|nr:hypothetical protein DM02DRAFT_728058 [Periconia macrospinosa]
MATEIDLFATKNMLGSFKSFYTSLDVASVRCTEDVSLFAQAVFNVHKQSETKRRRKWRGEANPTILIPVQRQTSLLKSLTWSTTTTTTADTLFLQPRLRPDIHNHANPDLTAQELEIAMSTKELSNLIDRALRSTSTCGICTEAFSASHPPVALRCTHIFGHKCIKKWLLSRRQNSNTCPLCRSAVFDASVDDGNTNRNSNDRGSGIGYGDTDADLWRALCEIAEYEEQHEQEDAMELINEFMRKMWEGVCGMSQRHRQSHLQKETQTKGRNRRRPSSSSRSSSCSSSSLSPLPSIRKEKVDADETTSPSFTAAEYLLNAILPALIHTSSSPDVALPSSRSLRRQHQKNRLLFLESHNLLHATFLSLNRPSTFTRGLATPLVRLARLLTQCSGVMPRWLTSVARTSHLFWNANACLGGPGQRQIEQISWKHIQEATHLTSPRYFPLLHLYTILISQTLVHLPIPQDNVSLILERCCTRIGGSWADSPSTGLKQLCVAVYTELKRCQIEGGAASLRAKTWESDVVRGLWGLAGWVGRGKKGLTLRDS